MAEAITEAVPMQLLEKGAENGAWRKLLGTAVALHCCADIPTRIELREGTSWMGHLLEDPLGERLHGEKVIGCCDGVGAAQQLRGSRRLLHGDSEAGDLQQLARGRPSVPDQALL